MTPTLFGRIQSRIFLVIVVGVPLAFVLALFLPSNGAEYGDLLEVYLYALGIVAVAGIVWEIIYHGLQQFRWEKDWPTVFGLLQGIPEAVSTFIILDAGIVKDFGDVPLDVFLPMFIIVWIVIWLVANGPLQIFFIRWRYRGGRFV